MRKTIYIETTIVSYHTARPNRDLMIAAHQQTTNELWPGLMSQFEAYISALVLEEAGKGDPTLATMRLREIEQLPVLAIDGEVRALAERLVEDGAIPREYPEDALHIAVAAVNGIDVLLTWNFAHLNNPFTRIKTRRIVEKAGYQCPEICSPDEITEIGK